MLNPFSTGYLLAQVMAGITAQAPTRGDIIDTPAAPDNGAQSMADWPTVNQFAGLNYLEAFAQGLRLVPEPIGAQAAAQEFGETYTNRWANDIRPGTLDQIIINGPPTRPTTTTTTTIEDRYAVDRRPAVQSSDPGGHVTGSDPSPAEQDISPSAVPIQSGDKYSYYSENRFETNDPMYALMEWDGGSAHQVRDSRHFLGELDQTYPAGSSQYNYIKEYVTSRYKIMLGKYGPGTTISRLGVAVTVA